MVDEQEEPSLLRRAWAFVCQHKFLFISLTVAIAAVVVVLLVRHYSQTPEQRFGRGRGGPNGGISVAVATVTTGDIVVRIPALGTITPLATVTVKTQINGQLQKIAFKEGQLVHEGDFLAQIDPRPYEAVLNQMNANMHRDEALLSDAELNLKRYEDLIKEDSVAQQQLDTQKSLVNQYRGTLQGDQAQIKTAMLNLQYARIVSPVTGRVGLRQVDEGNYVTAGDANGIVVVTQLRPITAIFSIPEDNVTSIMRRLHDGATLPVQAYDRSNSNKLADGKLLSIDNQIDATTGTFKLRAVFDNKDDMLFPNQFVNIQLLVNVLHDQIIMPNAAVHRGAPNGVI
ncbi:MAG TPA: efflux RND transporter periplasmic adaptor subunit, partial [Steroidobacteraceae bacterium]|nr:efflux RND transporter periplasmic adaptor subunit [Steroidobacteraceae bacterium]